MAEEKRLLIALLGLLALLGCSKDHPEVEPVETGTPIVFGSRMSEEEAVTRAVASAWSAQPTPPLYCAGKCVTSIPACPIRGALAETIRKCIRRSDSKNVRASFCRLH